MYKLIQVIALLSLICGPAAARDYYLDVRGDDRASGRSPATAWQTLGRATSHSFQPGDRILLCAGQRFPGTLRLGEDDRSTPARPIVIATWYTSSDSSTSRATIAAGSADGIVVTSIGGIEIRDLIVEGTDQKAGEGTGVMVINLLPDARRLRHVRLIDVDAHGFGRQGIFVGGWPDDKSQSGYEDVLIDRCQAYDNLYFGIIVTGIWDMYTKAYANRNVTFTRSIAHDNPGDPDYLQNHSGSGIWLDNVDGGRIAYCTAFRNGRQCNNPGGGPVGIWAHAANRVVIEHNLAYENGTGRGLDGGGFDFDGGVSNSIMQYNQSYNNDGAGYLIYVYKNAPHTFHDNIIRYNTSINDGRKNGYAAFFIGNDGHGVEDIDVYGNTVYMEPAPTGTPSVLKIFRTKNVRVYDNRFVVAPGVPVEVVEPNNEGLVIRDNEVVREASPRPAPVSFETNSEK